MKILVGGMWTPLYRRRVTVVLLKLTREFPYVLTSEHSTRQPRRTPQNHANICVIFWKLSCSISLGIGPTLSPKAWEQPGIVPVCAVDCAVWGSRKSFQPAEPQGSRADTPRHPYSSSSMTRIWKAHHCKHWHSILSLCYFSCFLALQF